MLALHVDHVHARSETDEDAYRSRLGTEVEGEVPGRVASILKVLRKERHSRRSRARRAMGFFRRRAVLVMAGAACGGADDPRD